MRYPEVPLSFLSAVPITNGLGEAAADGDDAWARYIRTTDIASLFSLDDAKRVTLPPEVSIKAMLEPGDILMTAAGSLGTSYLFDGHEPACYAGYLVRFRPDSERLDGRFAAHWTQSQHHLDQIETGAVRSTIDNYSAGKFRQTKIPLPPIAEQRRIADFLDDQTTRIDQIIALRKTQGERLWEHAYRIVVERTLDPEGRIPIRRLIEDERLGVWGDEPVGNPDDSQVARVADFDRKVFKLGPVPTYRNVEPGQLRRRLLEHGDVLLERSGGTQRNPVGCAVFVENPGPSMVSSNFVSRLRPAADVDGRYLSLALASLYVTGQQRPHSTQTTGIMNLNTTSYFSERVAAPARIEQTAIARALDAELDAASRGEGLQLASIDRFEEFKRSLISAAVSGEFDVSAASGRGVSV